MHTLFFTEIWLTTVAKIRMIAISYWPRKRSVLNFWNDLHMYFLWWTWFWSVRPNHVAENNELLSCDWIYRNCKARDIHLDNEILIAIPRQKWLRERATLFRLYVHCLSCSVSYFSENTSIYKLPITKPLHARYGTQTLKATCTCNCRPKYLYIIMCRYKMQDPANIIMIGVNFTYFPWYVKLKYNICMEVPTTFWLELAVQKLPCLNSQPPLLLL